jgi:hypothetical protein
MGMSAAGVEEPLLSEQDRTAVIYAVCRCGCSSARLRSDEPAIPPARVSQRFEQGRDDLFRVQAFSNDPAQELVYVELHVVRGRVEELEVPTPPGVTALPSPSPGSWDWARSPSADRRRSSLNGPSPGEQRSFLPTRAQVSLKPPSGRASAGVLERPTQRHSFGAPPGDVCLLW